MGRVLSGETPIVASSIKLRKDAYSLAHGWQTALEDIASIFLLADHLKTIGSLGENSDGLCGEKLIAAFVGGFRDLCGLKGVMVPISQIDGLSSFMQAFRQVGNYYYCQIFPKAAHPGSTSTS